MKLLNNRKLESNQGIRECSLPANYSGARGISLAAIAICTAFALSAEAVTFDGETSGIFANPAGPSGMVVTGENTPNFSWGTAVQPSTVSSLTFTGANFSGIAVDQFFTLGNLEYRNGTLLSGTQASFVDLLTSIEFTSPIGLTQDLNFAFQLINTPNVAGDPIGSADTIDLTNLFPTINFTIDGIEYTLTTGFGSVTPGGFVQVDSFSVLEDQSASAELVGRITAVTPPPSVPDAGSTLGFMAMAIVGLGGLKQYLTRKA